MNILVIGGYGFFGAKLVRSLLTYYDHSIVIAGRSLERAQKFQMQLFEEFTKPTTSIQIDIQTSELESLFARYEIDVVVNASGPFQLQRKPADSYRVARACIEAGCHYIDLADDRQFVVNFPTTLHSQALAKNVMLVSGASTVPGLTCAVIDDHIDHFESLTHIYHGIAPGNRAEKGLATVGSILSYTGRSFPILRNKQHKYVYGWQHLRSYDFGAPLGRRWFGNCQIPDLDLLPRRYPTLENVWFQASLEVPLFHWSLWALSWLTRTGLLSNLLSLAKTIAAVGNFFTGLGTDSGGMFVRLHGNDHRGLPLTIDWQLIAENGVGPNVPTISAELIIERISTGRIVAGAMPCVGLFTLAEFFSIAQRWGIYCRNRVIPITQPTSICP